ncbi:MAG: RNA methyltransferase [Candidatus Thermoplasmatota archaeon]|nr:RNA methyltransferase [Candidatus Thermoplasmatota archaeon]
MKRRTLNKEALQKKRSSYQKIFSETLSELDKRVSVILVAPKYGGNIGAVARLMRNYGLSDLRFVSPPEIGDEAMARAMNGKDILLNARRYGNMQDAIDGFRIVAATSSAITLDDRKFRRLPETPAKFWKRALKTDGNIALVFGREDDGLRNTEIEMCNSFIHIPSNPEYPVLNLSHAVSIILYEMIRDLEQKLPQTSDPIEDENMSRLVDSVMDIITMTDYPEYKIPNTRVMLSRLMARSEMTQSEYFKIMGIIRFLRFKLGTDGTNGEAPEKLY